MLVEELQPERQASYSPLFQVMYVPQNITMEATELPGFAISPVELENPTAKFDLTLETAETKEEFIVSLDHNTDLFDSSPVKKMLDHFKVLMERIVENPGQSISALPLLTEAGRHQVLVE